VQRPSEATIEAAVQYRLRPGGGTELVEVALRG
jgi:hypothetical protein